MLEMTWTVAFGPKGGFLFSSFNQMSCLLLPTAIQDMFDTDRVNNPYCLAIGENDSYCFAFAHATLGPYIMRRNLPAGLEAYVKPYPDGRNRRNLSTLNVMLGTSGAYFAFDQSSCTWGNLPADMIRAIESRLDSSGRFRIGKEPQSVGFGPNGSWFFIDTSGVYNYSQSLYREMPRVKGFLDHCDDLVGIFIDSSIHEHDTYVIGNIRGGCSAHVAKTLEPFFSIYKHDWDETTDLPNKMRR